MEAARRAMQRDHDEDPDDDRQREVSVRRPLEGWDRHQTRRTDRSGIFLPLRRNAREAKLDVTAARRNYRKRRKLLSAATSSDPATGWRRRAPILEGSLEIFGGTRVVYDRYGTRIMIR